MYMYLGITVFTISIANLSFFCLACATLYSRLCVSSAQSPTPVRARPPAAPTSEPLSSLLLSITTSSISARTCSWWLASPLVLLLSASSSRCRVSFSWLSSDLRVRSLCVNCSCSARSSSIKRDASARARCRCSSQVRCSLVCSSSSSLHHKNQHQSQTSFNVNLRFVFKP